MTRDYHSIEVQPLSGALGAEIHGVDLGEKLGDDALDEMRRAYDQFGVIFFRDQTLSPEQHIAFARVIAGIFG